MKQCRQGPTLVPGCSFFGIWISMPHTFQLLLLNIMDLRNKTFLMVFLFDCLEIFNQDLFASTMYLFLVFPVRGKTAESLCSSWTRAPVPLAGEGWHQDHARGEDRRVGSVQLLLPLSSFPAAALSALLPGGVRALFTDRTSFPARF